MDFWSNLINSISKKVILYQMWPRFGAKMVLNLAKDLLRIKSKKLILELWSLFLDRFWAAFSYFFVYSTWEISNSILIWTRESLEHHICTEISETQKISYNKAVRNRENSSAVVLFGSIAFKGHAMRLYGDTQSLNLLFLFPKTQ